MTVRNLRFLFRPTSVALIGASRAEGTVGSVVARNLIGGRLDGPVLPVSAVDRSIEGVLAYRSVEDLPVTPDLAVICGPAEAVPATLDRLGRRGTRAAVVLGDGFAEATTRRMLDAARPHLLRVLGPRSLGVMVPGIGLNASAGPIAPAVGDVALVAQSSMVVTSVVDWAVARGFGFSHVVSLGDMADIDFGDLIDQLALDGAVRAILLYIERVTDARKFLSAARSAARQKPVIVIKAGRTGENADDDAVYDAAFRRAGLLRVETLDDLFDAVGTLASGTTIGGDRLAIVTNGSGMGLMATDLLLGRGGRLAELAPDTRAALAMLTQGPPSNPVRLGADAGPDPFAAALAATLGDPGCDAVLVLHCPNALTDRIAIAESVIGVATRQTDGAQRPVLTNWLGDGAAIEARRRFAAARIPTYDTPARAVGGFLHLHDYRHNQELLMETPPSIAEDRAFDLAAARAALNTARGAEGELARAEAERLLSAYGLPVAGGGPPGPAGLLIGMTTNDVFGPVLFVAANTGPRALALPPLNLKLAGEVIAQAALPEARWTGDLALALVRLSQLVVDWPQVTGVSMAPLAADGAGARIWLGSATARRLAIRPYPKELEGTAVARDGRSYRVRPVLPEDEPLLHAMFERMTPEDVRLRFFAPLKRLSHPAAARLTQIDYDREMGLVALAPEPATGRMAMFGVVRIASLPDSRRAEYAVMVRSDMKGKGLGFILMNRILDYAREAGIREVFGEVLRENTGMLAMCRTLGFVRRESPDDPGIVEVRIELGGGLDAT